MKNMRNAIATATLAVVMIFGTNMANAGILLSDLKGETSETCKETSEKMDWGILLSDFAGILLSDFSGTIIVGSAKQDPTVNCGILLSD